MFSRVFVIFVGLAVALGGLGAWVWFHQDQLPQEVVDALPKRGEAAGSEQAEIILPTFDIVRVDAAGTSVIAGRGVSEATVVVLANGEEAARAKVGDGGEWAVYIDTAFDNGTVELTLKMILEDGTVRRGEQVVAIAVPERSGEKPLVVMGQPGAPTQVLQNPHGGDDTMVLTLDMVEYDSEGALVLSGRADPGAALRIYANNRLIGDLKAGATGHWTLRPRAPLAPGVYSLRIDQLGKDGKVHLRIELPLERAEPSDVLAAVQKGGGRVVVQPGNSLWRIARRVYGSGFEYTIIYDANQDQIRDPNVIYPGQILDLPVEHELDAELQLLQ